MILLDNIVDEIDEHFDNLFDDWSLTSEYLMFVTNHKHLGNVEYRNDVALKFCYLITYMLYHNLIDKTCFINIGVRHLFRYECLLQFRIKVEKQRCPWKRYRIEHNLSDWLTDMKQLEMMSRYLNYRARNDPLLLVL